MLKKIFGNSLCDTANLAQKVSLIAAPQMLTSGVLRLNHLLSIVGFCGRPQKAVVFEIWNAWKNTWIDKLD